MEATGRDGKSYHYYDDYEEEEIHDDSREHHLSVSSLELLLQLRRADCMLDPPRSYHLHEQRQSTVSSSHTSITSSSSSSGTIVSTAYTSSGSRLSSVSMVAAMHFDFDLDGGNKEQIIKQITSLVQEFSIPAAGASVLERWFAELGVTWVLHLGHVDGASAAAVLDDAFDNASSWIRALAKITATISLMGSLSLCSDSDPGSSVALPSICEEEEERLEIANGKEEATVVPPDRFNLAQFIQKTKTMMKMVGLVLVGKEQLTENKASVQFQDQFAQFTRETMLKMLAFVDLVFAPAETTRQDLVGNGCFRLGTYKYRLHALLDVRDALSSALTKIQLSFLSQPSADAQVKRIQDEIVSLLSAADSMADEAILTRLEQARTRFLELLIEDEDEDGDNSNSSGTPTWQGSSDIHETSRHVIMGYVTFIHHHYNAPYRAVFKAAYLGKYVPRFRDVETLDDRFDMEMVSCLQENLATKSELFLDQSLRFLFLINNLYFILVNLTSNSLILSNPFTCINVATSRKPDCIEPVETLRLLSGYLDSYIQVSWAPVLACLSNSTPLCFGREYSQLSKFESEFQKTYTTQKQWKVPSPRMRKMLRNEITRRIIPGYTNYIEDNKATTPKFSPSVLKDKLQQLFEG